MVRVCGCAERRTTEEKTGDRAVCAVIERHPLGSSIQHHHHVHEIGAVKRVTPRRIHSLTYCTMRCLECILPLLLIESVSGFASAPSGSRYHCLIHVCWSATGDATATHATMDPKEAVKLFGRLAEKYIMLDPTAGMCCYSGCTDCEFRLPGGGYRMADQSAARPKWIPIYEQRSVEATGKEHATKWSTQIFVHGPAVTKDAFVETLTGLEYAPPLGGPYLSTSAAQLDDVAPAEALFDLLAGGKEKLTKHRMGIRLKEMANGEEGINWATFQAAVGIS